MLNYQRVNPFSQHFLPTKNIFAAPGFGRRGILRHVRFAAVPTEARTDPIKAPSDGIHIYKDK